MLSPGSWRIVIILVACALLDRRVDEIFHPDISGTFPLRILLRNMQWPTAIPVGKEMRWTRQTSNRWKAQ